MGDIPLEDSVTNLPQYRVVVGNYRQYMIRWMLWENLRDSYLR